ncbi:MAG: efflux transporter outer membrane subunit, partial [Caulobacteraceae bacterium]
MPSPNKVPRPSPPVKGREASVLAALTLAGCAAVGPNFHRPEAPAAGGYAMAGDKVPALATLAPEARTSGPWWLALGSSDLDAVMAEALADNQSVAQANASLERAREAARSVAGGLEPQVDANAGVQRERINTQAFGISGFPSPTINLYTVGATVSYDLDLFGGGRRRLEEARARAEAVGERADAAYLALTGNVALQGVKIAGVRARIAAVQAIIADDETNLAIVRKAQAAGGEAPSATNVGEAQLEADRALLPPLAQQLDQARHGLALLVGRPPGAWRAPDFSMAGFSPPATIPISLPSQLVRRRPDILAAEADLHADVADLGVAAAALYPDVRLTAGLTQEALTTARFFSFSST